MLNNLHITATAPRLPADKPLNELVIGDTVYHLSCRNGAGRWTVRLAVITKVTPKGVFAQYEGAGYLPELFLFQCDGPGRILAWASCKSNRRIQTTLPAEVYLLRDVRAALAAAEPLAVAA